MRPKSLLLLCLVTISIVSFLLQRDATQDSQLPATTQRALTITAPKRAPEPHTGPFETSLFVPYWNVPTSKPNLPTVPSTRLSTLIYFGITPDETGRIRRDEPGFRTLSSFSAFNNRSLLTIRMMDESTNRLILEDHARQQTLLADAISIAHSYSFDGILLDLEHSVLPTSDTTNDITRFITSFSQATNASNLDFAIAIYGDTYYRIRPYDTKAIAPLIDQMYIMAYDFHKSYGEPGPNFPLNTHHDGLKRYAYSLEKMLADFTKHVPPAKISVLFGVYGYDWSVDDQNRPAKAATARPLSQIQARFYPKCPFSSCTIRTDPASTETNITYTDDSGQKHNLWSETLTSLATKTDFLRSQGVSQIGFWTYGYY